MNTPGGNTVSTAEHTVSMILALSRNIPQASASMKLGQWKRKAFMGKELYNKTLGIIGFGRVGAEVTKRAVSFGMRVIAYDPFISLEIAKQLGVEVVELKELLSRSDYISVHTPLSKETKHMLSDDEFSLMKDNVRIINCARGGIIDEEALLKAIDSGKVAGCALDVFEKEPPAADYPLLKRDNVIATPHLGASTEEAQVNVAVEIADVVKDALLGGGIRNAANFPCVEPEVYKILDPYINLSGKLGCISAQLVKGRISKVSINYGGQISQLETEPLTSALIEGLFKPILQEAVNSVNALSLAKERGIKIQESKSTSEEEFVNLISLEITTDKEKLRVDGTLSSNKQPRIVKIKDFYVEVIPEGHMLIIHNLDKPGIIGAIGTILSKSKINIAAMTLGREKAGGSCITVINVDSPLSENILKQIEDTENILSVQPIQI